MQHKAGTVTPPSENVTSIQGFLSPTHNDPFSSQNFSQYSQTQRLTQASQIPTATYEVEDEENKGVWGYLVPVDGRHGSYEPLVLRERNGCNANEEEISAVPKKQYEKQEQAIEKRKEKDKPSRGFLLGRHPECGKLFTVELKYTANRLEILSSILLLFRTVTA
jgi:serine/threonine-protein kinase CHEK2